MKLLRGKTVLVTGAGGFIGCHLVGRLQQIPDISIVAISGKSKIVNKENIIHITCPIEQLSQDVWSKNGIEKFDFIFHLAAFTPKTSEDANRLPDIYRNNIFGTRILLESLPRVPSKIIFSSTLDVYSPLPQGGILNELSPIGNISLYGASKLFCEEIVRTYADRQQCGYAIIRYGHIFGPGEEAYGKLIPQTIKKLLEGKTPELYGDGGVWRDFLYVDDAVEATLRSAVSAHQVLDPINIVRGKSTSIKNIVESLIKITGFSGEIKYIKARAGDYSLYFDSKLMLEKLGKWNFISLEEGLRREVDYFRRLKNNV